MLTLELDLPTEIFSALRCSPRELGPELRLAAAVHWYSKGRISQERAAQLAGLDRTDFLMALAREGVDSLVNRSHRQKVPATRLWYLGFASFRFDNPNWTNDNKDGNGRAGQSGGDC